MALTAAGSIGNIPQRPHRQIPQRHLPVGPLRCIPHIPCSPLEPLRHFPLSPLEPFSVRWRVGSAYVRHGRGVAEPQCDGGNERQPPNTSVCNSQSSGILQNDVTKQLKLKLSLSNGVHHSLLPLYLASHSIISYVVCFTWSAIWLPVCVRNTTSQTPRPGGPHFCCIIVS